MNSPETSVKTKSARPANVSNCRMVACCWRKGSPHDVSRSSEDHKITSGPQRPSQLSTSLSTSSPSNNHTTSITLQVVNMKITVVPASMNTGRATISALLAEPSAPSVTGIYRDLNKVPAEFKKNPNFNAVQGDVSDPSTLDLSGAHVVVTASPPQYAETDPVALARLFAQNIEHAIAKAASVRRLVYISSGGAQHENGTVSIPHRNRYPDMTNAGDRARSRRTGPPSRSSGTRRRRSSSSAARTLWRTGPWGWRR